MILCVCPNPAIDSFFDMDSFGIAEVNRSKQERYYPGGKAVHVAMAIAELGEEVALLGFWGGLTGKWIRKECAKKGIICHGPEVKENSRFNIIFRSSKSRIDETQILASGPKIDKIAYAVFKEQFEKLIKLSHCVVMSGSWPNSANNNEYGELTRIANKHMIPAFIDFTGEQFKNVLTADPYGMHLNLQESQELFGEHITELQIINEMGKYSKFSLLTMGEKGLYMKYNDRIYRGNCKLNRVISTVGSGDCSMAGLAVSYARKYNPHDTVKLTTACGAANCMREELGMLYKKDVKKLLSKVKIMEINP